jgi:suppressor for copper-sensitivity B
MSTVVFILSFIEPAAVVPTVLLLVGIGMACWLVARTPLTAEIRDRLNSWAMSGAVVLLFAVASFGWLYPEVMYPRYGNLQSVVQEGWEPFSLVHLQRTAVRDGRTVIVDFSADWCFNCKALEKTQLHTTAVEGAIETANAVKMYADFTDYPEELKDTIKALRSSGVPIIAVFPGDRPYEPIVFRGGYTKTHIVDALASAKPRADALLGVNPNAATTAATR